MPELSRFYGIHHPHVLRTNRTPPNAAFSRILSGYQEHVAIFGVEPVELIAGSLPQRQQRLVEAWAELHKEELASDWALLQNGKRPAPIEPLH